MRILTHRLPLTRAPALLRLASIQRQLPFRHPSSPSSIAPHPDTDNTTPIPPSLTHIHPTTLERPGLSWKSPRLATPDTSHGLAPPPPAEDGDDDDDVEEYPDEPEVDEPVELDADAMYTQRGPHHGEVKGNPTESEADVWADRTDEDPLVVGRQDDVATVIELPAGEAGARPTESEERVRADRAQEDPLRAGGYC